MSLSRILSAIPSILRRTNWLKVGSESLSNQAAQPLKIVSTPVLNQQVNLFTTKTTSLPAERLWSFFGLNRSLNYSKPIAKRIEFFKKPTRTFFSSPSDKHSEVVLNQWKNYFEGRVRPLLFNDRYAPVRLSVTDPNKPVHPLTKQFLEQLRGCKTQDDLVNLVVDPRFHKGDLAKTLEKARTDSNFCKYFKEVDIESTSFRHK